MRPGIPWSVKGIDDETRQAAKLAARKAGLTLGQWLNTVIKETADDDVSGDSEQSSPMRVEQGQQSREFTSVRQPIQTRSTSRSASTDHDFSRRLDSLAGQLSMLSESRPQPAASRFIEPKRDTYQDHLDIQALIDRVEAYEQNSADAINRVHARLENVTDKLTSAAAPAPVAPAPVAPQKPEDVPGFSALETAMRNIVDHIEISEIATSDTLKTIQQRMSDMATRATEAASEQLSSNAPAISTLEQRVNELTARLDKSRNDTSRELQAYVQGKVNQLAERIDAVRHSTDAVVGQAQAAAVQAARGEGQQLEDRLKSIIGELQGKQSPDADVQRIYADIESLNQRLDDVNASTVPESDIDALRSTVENLSGQMAKGHDPAPVQQLEARLLELGQRLEQLDTSALAPQLSDLEHRVQAMDTQLSAAMANPGDPASANRFADQMSSVGERLSATESKLKHLNTIEQAIEQLYRSVEETRALAGQTAEDAAQRMAEHLMANGQQVAGADLGVPSAELQALESGLVAVKASAESADQRTQETLEAVHDTLEQIIDKLAELEQQAPAAAQAAPQVIPVEPTPEMMVASEFASALPPVQPEIEPVAAQMADPFAQDAHAAEPAPLASEQPEYAPVEPAMMPDLAAPVDEVVSGLNQQIPEVQHETFSEAAQPAAADGVHEDFIAAARRAAQNAATQRTSILGNLTSRAPASAGVDKGPSKLGSLFSLPFRRSKDDQLAGDLPEPGPGEDGDTPKKSRRLHLILAGLVLLAAVSAYSFGGVGKKLFSDAMNGGSNAQVSVPQSKFGSLTSNGSVSTAAVTSGKHTASQVPSASTVKPVTAAAAGQAEIDEPPSLPLADLTTNSVTPAAATGDAAAFATDTGMPVSIGTVDQSALPAIDAAFSSSTAGSTSLPAELGSKALRDAAETGDANAQFVVASRYLDGKAVTRDFKQAANWYRKAADSGLAPAQYRLGTLYERGHGMVKNVQLARMWYERAAQAKNVKAMHNLAVIYANNTNNDAKFDKAAKWFRGAADHGLKDSLYNLAVLYERGLGVSQDTKTAYFWYGIAARHGDADGKAKTATLASFLTGAQKKEADSRVAKWAPQKPDSKGNFVAITDPAWQVAVASPAAPAPGNSAVDGLSEQQLVLKAQQLLSGMGYDVGPVDGVMGSRTANAVRLFQLQTGAPVNGSVTADLVKLLAARKS